MGLGAASGVGGGTAGATGSGTAVPQGGTNPFKELGELRAGRIGQVDVRTDFMKLLEQGALPLLQQILGGASGGEPFNPFAGIAGDVPNPAAAQQAGQGAGLNSFLFGGVPPPAQPPLQGLQAGGALDPNAFSVVGEQGPELIPPGNQQVIPLQPQGTGGIPARPGGQFDQPGGPIPILPPLLGQGQGAGLTPDPSQIKRQPGGMGQAPLPPPPGGGPIPVLPPGPGQGGGQLGDLIGQLGGQGAGLPARPQGQQPAGPVLGLPQLGVGSDPAQLQKQQGGGVVPQAQGGLAADPSQIQRQPGGLGGGLPAQPLGITPPAQGQGVRPPGTTGGFGQGTGFAGQGGGPVLGLPQTGGVPQGGGLPGGGILTEQSPVDPQAQGGGQIQDLLSQPSPEGQVFQQALEGLNLGQNPGQGVLDALGPVFQRNLQQSLGQLRNTAPSVFNSGLGLEGTDLAARSLQDFNLLGSQALQQGVSQQQQGFGTLGQLAGQAGQNPFNRALGAGQLATQRDLGFGQLGLQAQQQQFNQATNPALQMLMAALGFAQPTGLQTVARGG